MHCPYCEWEGSPEEYLKHYKDAGHGVESSIWQEKAALEITNMIMAHGPYRTGERDALVSRIEEILVKNKKEWG